MFLFVDLLNLLSVSLFIGHTCCKSSTTTPPNQSAA
jgi:hypothetical protein